MEIIESYDKYECFIFYGQIVALFIYLVISKVFRYCKIRSKAENYATDPFCMLLESNEDFLGNDNYSLLITGRIIKENGIKAMESKFDWLLSGCNADYKNQQEPFFKIATLPISNDYLDSTVQNFWTSSIDFIDHVENHDVLRMFKDTKFDDVEKRYVVQLPW